MKLRKLGALAVAIILLGLTACNSSNENKQENNNNSKDETPQMTMPVPGGDNESKSDESTINPDNEETLDNSESSDLTDEHNPHVPEFRNKLTGLETTQELSRQRPMAIMFNNLKAALPQHGISEMDVVYEAIVEGSITRLLGFVTDWSSLTTLGSIRSSRDYYIDFSDAHNAIYVHAGGSELAYSEMSRRGTDHIDGVNGNRVSSNAFYRNQERRKKGVSTEHTLFTNGANLIAAIEGNKFTTTLEPDFVSPFKFSDYPLEFEGDAANYVYIPFSNYAQSYFDYDAEKGLYFKGQYVSSKSSVDKHDSPHIDGNNNQQLTFKNILILYTDYTTIDSVGRQAIRFTGTGTGYYITDGKCKPIKWSRPSRTGGYTIFEEDGATELLMNSGKTYVGVLKTNTKIIYK